MKREKRFESWKNVWERKGREAKGITLSELITADGFDGGAGKMDEKMWTERVENIKASLKLYEADSLLEVGCGSGAMLLPLSAMNLNLAGIDYSAPLVSIAQKAVPDAEIKVSEASSIPFPDGSFSRVLSHGVFHYFPHEDYAKEVMAEMLRVLKKGGGLLISDVPDMEKKEESEGRRKSLAESDGKNYRTGSEGDFSHLYFTKGFFTDFFKSYGLRAAILEWPEEKYGNARFRFHVSVWVR
ncbi:MAG: class I SAM-dependent methyltransferase [Thermodesulfobacteriota bacterium]|nr:class I SAM-dependent methyltransferase [Thermodesulfobacteriota bacterium]